MKVIDYLKRNWITILIIGLAIILIALLILAIINLDHKNVNFYLAFSTIVSSLLIAITLYVTIRNNKENTDNFIKAEEESKKQFEIEIVESKEQFDIERKEVQKQFDEQQRFFQIQQFESTFFNMMKQLEDIISKLTLEDKTGRDVFEQFYLKIGAKIYNKDNSNYVKSIKDTKKLLVDPDYQCHINEELEKPKVYIVEKDECGFRILSEKGVYGIIFYLGLNGYELINNIHILDHYFRYLYRILKFVDQSEFLEEDKDYRDMRYRYTSILRATLSPYELVLLFYNGLLKKGTSKLKPLLEKYTMLKNLRSDLLVKREENQPVNITYTDEYESSIQYDRSAHFKRDNNHLKNK